MLYAQAGLEMTGSNVDHDFLNEMNPESAWLIGLIASDGYISNNGRFVSFHMKDDHLLNQVKEITKFNGKIYLTKAGTRLMNIYSLKWVLALDRLGIKNKKSLSLRLPNIEEAVFFDFLRGYFDGDGSFWNISKPLRTDKTLRAQIIGSNCFISELNTYLFTHYGFPIRNIYPAGNAAKILYAHYDSLMLGENMYKHNGPKHMLKYDLWRNAGLKGK